MSKEIKEVTYATLHTHLFIPGVGQFGPTLDGKGATSKPLTMWLSESGQFLLVEIDTKGRKHNAAVPMSNVIALLYKGEEVVTVAKAKIVGRINEQ